MIKPLLEVSGLEVRYGCVTALQGVSLRVDAGEIVALIGANGAGKTTTLKAVSGMLRCASGSVKLAGEPVSTLKPHEFVARGMAHAPEGRGIFLNLTVAENLELGAFLRNDKDAVAADLEKHFALFPQLKERRAQISGTLSGGEQQMLAVARALMSRPRLLLLDEPSLGLAPIVVESIFSVITAVNKEGVSVLLVEQNAHKALGIAHRGYVLETGRVATEGTGKELLDSPAVRVAYLGG